MIALGVGILSGIGIGIGIAASLVVAFTVFAALTLLPALLGFFGTRTLTRRARHDLAAGRPPRRDRRPRPHGRAGSRVGDGGVASSAQDLARFTEALFTGELVGAPTLGAMVSRSRHDRRAGYGLGVMIRQVPGAVVAGHEGMYFGWTASTGIDDATTTTIAVVTNLAGVSVPAAWLARVVRAALSPDRPRGRLPRRK